MEENMFLMDMWISLLLDHWEVFFVSSHVWMISINQAIFTLLVWSSKEPDWSLDTVSCVCDDVMQTVHHIALIVVL